MACGLYLLSHYLMRDNSHAPKRIFPATNTRVSIVIMRPVLLQTSKRVWLFLPVLCLLLRPTTSKEGRSWHASSSLFFQDFCVLSCLKRSSWIVKRTGLAKRAPHQQQSRPRCQHGRRRCDRLCILPENGRLSRDRSGHHDPIGSSGCAGSWFAHNSERAFRRLFEFPTRLSYQGLYIRIVVVETHSIVTETRFIVACEVRIINSPPQLSPPPADPRVCLLHIA